MKFRFSTLSEENHTKAAVEHVHETRSPSQLERPERGGDTSFRGIPFGSGNNFLSRCSLIRAHFAIPVGPLAPASTAISAMTTTLTKGC